MIKRFNSLVFTFLVLVLSACASQYSALKPVMLMDDISYQLQSIPQQLRNTGFQSLLTVKHNKTEKQLIIQTEMGENNIVMIGLSPEGMNLFSINWCEPCQTLILEKQFPIDIDPARVIAEFQLAHWPIDSVQQGLSGAMFKLDESNTRMLTNLHKQLLYTIEKNDQTFILKNKKLGYQLSIQELERWTID